MGEKRLVEMPLWYAIGGQYIGISNDEEYWQTLSSIFEQPWTGDAGHRGPAGSAPKP